MSSSHGAARDITDTLSSQRRGRTLFIGAVVLLVFAVVQTIQFAQFTRTSDEAKAQSLPLDVSEQRTSHDKQQRLMTSAD